MNSFDCIIITISLLPAVLMLSFTPYFTRKTEQFGVTIPENLYNNHEIIQLRKQFVLKSGLLSIFLLF